MAVNTTVAGILTLFGVCCQLIARIFYLNGSLDHAWTLLMALPPFSLVPSIMIWVGAIEPGKGGSPIDWWTLVPFLSFIMGDFIVRKINVRSTLLGGILKYYVLFFGFLIANYFHKIWSCPEETKVKWHKTFLQSMEISGWAVAVSIIAGIIIPFLPFAGWIIKLIDMIIPGLFSGLIITCIYILCNMLQNTEPAYYCTEAGNSISAIIAAFIGVIICIIREFIPI
tara:strand:- start:2525 stop:3202 length:678 start_codon:yes stop_codon:yes gene_type:complete